MNWPGGKAFAFTVFDDPDGQTLEIGREVYSCLHDLGFRTTKGVWPLAANLPPGWGGSCEEPQYRDWCCTLQEQGFEIGYHNARQTTSVREDTRRALDRFAEIFGHDPVTMSNHYNCDENVYWGDYRVSSSRRLLYNVLTRGRNHQRSFGHIAGHPLFWGDLCHDRIEYVRNFVFSEINTLAACPIMPYHDADRPLVKQWYASSEGADVSRFTSMLSEKNQDRLVAEGGACIMYTHFGHGYVTDGRLSARFRSLMTRLSALNGWFVPVRTLLDYIVAQRGPQVISNSQRTVLERRWLWNKVRHRTS
jgi:hypothetical protein